MVDIPRAVRLNRSYARSLGWGRHYERIVYAFSSIFQRDLREGRGALPSPLPPRPGAPAYERNPNAEEFAHIVEFFQTWTHSQSRVPNLVEDAILGNLTWIAIQSTSDYRNPAGGPANVGPWSYQDFEGTILTNFDFNSAQLKSDHELWLYEFARSKLPGLAGHVLLIGVTDRSGGEGYNLNLSNRRAVSVYHFLVRQIVVSSSVQIHVVPKGEELAGARADYAGSDRGVVVVYTPRPPPPLFIAQPLRTTRFYIRCLAMASVALPFGVPIGPRVLALQISDGAFSQLYTTAGLHIGEQPPFEVSGLGPWHILRSRREMTINDFRGAGSYHRRILRFSTLGITVQPFRLEPSGDDEMANPYGFVIQSPDGRPIRRGVPYPVQNWLMNGRPPGRGTMDRDF